MTKMTSLLCCRFHRWSRMVRALPVFRSESSTEDSAASGSCGNRAPQMHPAPPVDHLRLFRAQFGCREHKLGPGENSRQNVAHVMARCAKKSDGGKATADLAHEDAHSRGFIRTKMSSLYLFLFVVSSAKRFFVF